MFKVAKEFASDSAVATRHFLTGIFLLAGFNVCIAVAAFVSSTAIGDPAQGFNWFEAVMSFRDTGLREEFRRMIEVFNWCAFGTIVISGARAVLGYLGGLSRRPAVQIFELAAARQAVNHDKLPRVANM